MPAKRRLKNARITHVSLCRKGRNKLRTVMKSGGRIEIPLVVSKLDKTEGLLYSLVYVPEFPDVDEDVMDAAEIQKMAHGFLANGGNIDVEHDLDPLSPKQVLICETLIVQKGDERFSNLTYDDEVIDPTGSWGLVLKILDPELKAAYVAGEWDGVSMFGLAEGSPVNKTQPPYPETKVMDKEALEAIAKAVADALKKEREEQAVKDAEIKKAKDAEEIKKAEEAKKAKSVEFEGDPANLEDVEKHEKKLVLAKVDWNDPKSVAAYKATLDEDEDGDEDGEGDEGDDAEKIEKAKKAKKAKNTLEIAKLKKKIAELEKPSNVSGQDKEGDADAGVDPEDFGLTKSEMEGVQLGTDLIAAFEGRKKESKKDA